MARQRSRMRWLKDGDANSKLFHAVANGRRAKNFISAVKSGTEIITDQQGKERVFYDSFRALLGTIQNRESSIDLHTLGMPAHNLEDLEAIFSEEEIWGVIKEMPPDRAPGPDGFIGAFYKRAWPIIKGELMAAILKLYVGDGRTFERLNRALVTLITLIPKK
jgi:hypothetical protein